MYLFSTAKKAPGNRQKPSDSAHVPDFVFAHDLLLRNDLAKVQSKIASGKESSYRQEEVSRTINRPKRETAIIRKGRPRGER